ncbi:MAG: hypothetical protein ACK47E_16935 [Cyclobacteriaceae bacterium]
MRNHLSPPFLAFLLIAFFCSCSKLETSNAPTATKVNVPGLLKISFDAEVLKFQEVQDPSKSSDLQLIGAAPKALRSKIDIDVYDDGSTAWAIEKQEPKHDVKEHHLTPPDPSPQTKTTRIDRTGHGFFFGADGKLLRQHQIPVQSFKHIVEEVNANPNAVFGALGIPSAERLQKLVAKAIKNGATVQDLGNGLTSIRTKQGPQALANPSVRTANEGDYTPVDIIDTTLNLVIGSTLTDVKGETVSKSFYSNTFKDNQAFPQAIYQEVWNTEADGRKVKSTSNTYFYQLSYTINK